MPKEYGNGTVEFTAKVPEHLYNRFIGYFPMHGANTWLIKSFLENLLVELEKDPQAVQRVRDAIQTTIRTA